MHLPVLHALVLNGIQHSQICTLCQKSPFLVAGHLTPFNLLPSRCLYDWSFTGSKVPCIRSTIFHSRRKSKYQPACIHTAVSVGLHNTVSLIFDLVSASFSVTFLEFIPQRLPSTATKDPELTRKWAGAVGEGKGGIWTSEQPRHPVVIHFGTGCRATCCL